MRVSHQRVSRCSHTRPNENNLFLAFGYSLVGMLSCSCDGGCSFPHGFGAGQSQRLAFADDCGWQFDQTYAVMYDSMLVLFISDIGWKEDCVLRRRQSMSRFEIRSRGGGAENQEYGGGDQWFWTFCTRMTFKDLCRISQSKGLCYRRTRPRTFWACMSLYL